VRQPRFHAALLLLASGLALAACGDSAGGKITAAGVASPARWTARAHVRRVLDLTGPRGDGALVVAASGRLELVRPGAAPRPFATGVGGYASPGGEEPYIVLATGRGSCKFGPDTVYALRLTHGPGVTAIDAKGRARPFARLPGSGHGSGIAFDETGRFGRRLLVTSTIGSKTTVYAIDCRGAVAVITSRAPKVEGGIAVAPATFGKFAGDLIAPDESSGRIYAIAPGGASRLVAGSGLPHGGDIGVESIGFVPAGLGARWSALLADRLTPGNPHPGDDAILSIGSAALARAGVRTGDLLVATEGGARTDSINCGRSSCRVRHVADGPAGAHPEGHIAFAPVG
jgi:hypothetical protein